MVLTTKRFFMPLNAIDLIPTWNGLLRAESGTTPNQKEPGLSGLFFEAIKGNRFGIRDDFR